MIHGSSHGDGDVGSVAADPSVDHSTVLSTKENFRVLSLFTIIILLLHLEANDPDRFDLSPSAVSNRFRDSFFSKEQEKESKGNKTSHDINANDSSASENVAPIAICFMGQPRAKAPLYWRTMHSRLVEPIRDHVDVFFALSNGNSFGTANPDETGTHKEDELKYAHDLMKPKGIKMYRSSEEGMESRGGKMHWKGSEMHPVGWGAYQTLATHFCHELITAEEKRRGSQYKFVIKTRADLIVEGALPQYPEHWPNPAKIPPTAWVPTIGNCGTNWVYSGDPGDIACVNDHFAVLTGGWAARSYLQGIFEDYVFNHNVSIGALEVQGQGSCPECWVGLALSRRGIYKKLLANYMPEILWRTMHPPHQDKLNSLLEPLFGGAPNFPEVGKCETRECADEKCAPVIQRVPDIKFAAEYCHRLARKPQFYMELIPPKEEVVECLDAWGRRHKAILTKNSDFGQHGHASCLELGPNYIPA